LKSQTTTYNGIWQISYPIILSLVAQNVVNVTDTAFLGRVGEIELGASAIGGLFYIAIYMLGFGFGTGAQILIARRNGEKNFADIGRIFNNSLYFLFALALTLFLFIYFLSPLVLKPFINSEGVYKASVIFLHYRIFGIFLAFTNVAFRAFYVGIGKTRPLSYSSAVMAIVNVILGYLLIFGNFGFPKMGIAGAGLASVIAEGCSTVYFMIVTFRRKSLSIYGLFSFVGFDLGIVMKTLNISVFMMMQYFFSLGGWLIFFMIIEKMGERPLAVSNIIRSAYILLMVPVWAFSSATNTLVSNALGRGHAHDVLPITRKVITLSMASILPVIAFTLIFPRLILAVYTSDMNLTEATLPSLYVITGALFLFSFMNIMFNAVVGTANTNISMFIELFTLIIYLIAAWSIGVIFRQPIEVVWICEYIYFIVLGSLSFLYLRYGKWHLRVI
jgi:multidrug resistance protein, MATE family